MSYRFLEKVNLGLTVIHVGERDDMFYEGWTAARIVMKGYNLVNVVFSYDWHPSVQPFLRLDNLLNEEYEVIKGYGTPGFSIYGGIQLHF